MELGELDVHVIYIKNTPSKVSAVSLMGFSDVYFKGCTFIGIALFRIIPDVS